MEIKKSDFVQSLEKGLNVIRSFGAEHPTMTVTEVARKSDLTRANARRLLLTLQSLGYVNCVDQKNYSLSPKILSLGYSFLSSMSIQQLAQPLMQELATSINESCSMSVLDGKEIVYIARVQTKRIMTISLGIGTRLPLHATSMGKVLLSGKSAVERKAILKGYTFEDFTDHSLGQEEFYTELSKVEKQGYAISDQELEIGVRSIAVPVKNTSGQIIAALNISGHASRVTMEELLSNYLPALTNTADEIQNALNHL